METWQYSKLVLRLVPKCSKISTKELHGCWRKARLDKSQSAATRRWDIVVFSLSLSPYQIEFDIPVVKEELEAKIIEEDKTEDLTCG